MLIRKQFVKKSDTYKKAKISFIGCSRWMSEAAVQSPLTNGRRVVAIGNPIDTEIFKPVCADKAKRMFGISANKKVILFGAMSSDSDLRKGFKYLQRALDKLDPEKYLLVVFGNNNDNLQICGGFETFGVGRINSDEKLVALYSMADVFVAPSIQENLSNTIMEALACGTPVVAFDVGGMRDMIEHKRTGYLAIPFDVEDLAAGIRWVSTNKEKMKIRCREKIESDFSENRIGTLYLNLYNELL